MFPENSGKFLNVFREVLQTNSTIYIPSNYKTQIQVYFKRSPNLSNSLQFGHSQLFLVFTLVLILPPALFLSCWGCLPMLLFLLERSLCWSNCEIIVEVEEVEKERSCGGRMFVSWLFCCNSLVVANVFKSAKEAEKDGYD